MQLHKYMAKSSPGLAYSKRRLKILVPEWGWNWTCKTIELREHNKGHASTTTSTLPAAPEWFMIKTSMQHKLQHSTKVKDSLALE